MSQAHESTQVHETAVLPYSTASNISRSPQEMTASLAEESPIPNDPDFGDCVSQRGMIGQQVGSYRVVKPLKIITYQNDDGFTSTFDRFELIFGYGDTLEEAERMVIDFLVSQREFYSSLSAQHPRKLVRKM